MNTKIVEECSRLSDEEKSTFPEIVTRLLEAGVELYNVDFLTPCKTFYGKNVAHSIPSDLKSKKEVAATFNAPEIVRAIRQSQAGEIKYQEFKRKVMDAGVIGYIAFLTGRKVVYYGRNGDQHVEHFPKSFQ